MALGGAPLQDTLSGDRRMPRRPRAGQPGSGETGREHVVEVTSVIEKRVGAPLAATCYIDHSPPPPSKEEAGLLNFARDRGTGRPTKRDRRQLERARKQ